MNKPRTAMYVLGITTPIFLSIFCGLSPAHDSEPTTANDDLQMSPATVAAGEEQQVADPRSTVNWNGREYDCAKAVQVLVQLVSDRQAGEAERARALQTLRRVPSSYLHEEDIVEKLIAAFKELREPQERMDLLVVVHAWSPQSLPFLSNVLAVDEDLGVRQLAAAGLAAWNVRSGVAELVHILSQCRNESSIDRAVCNEAAKSFSWLNKHKGWGFPEDRIREEVLGKRSLSNEQKSAAFVAEIEDWFNENKPRFPDWKPGDPLPEVPKQEAQRP